MDDLAALELLSLVSKITSELQNHLGINERTLAEFIIAQHEKCSSLAEFKKSLDAMGAEFPQSLIESIDRLILTMHPKHKKKENGHAEQNGDTKNLDDGDRKARIFKGLSIPDREQKWDEEDPKLDKIRPDVDDTFAQLEGLADTGHQHSRKRRREDDRDYDRGRPRSNYNRLENDSGGHHGEKRRRSPPDPEFRRPPTPEVDPYPQLFKVYSGVVTGIKDFGAFVNLKGVKGKVDGLVHVSAVQEGARVNHPSDLLSQGQPVFVKVVKIEGSRIGLSMKEVDQLTGHDLAPQKRIASGANIERLNGKSGDDADSPIIKDFNARPRRDQKRLTSPERWEIRQLIASGVVSASDYPDLEEEHQMNGEPDSLPEDVDIELVEQEPPFLQGQTKQSLELSPIRIVKAPDGSLNRAAMAGSALAKERRELKQQEAAEKAEQASTVNLAEQWQDPMIAPEHRKFASEIRSAQTSRPMDSVPQWKRQPQMSEGFGRRTNMTIKQQRENLPIFGFRSKLLEAIGSNQVLIIVGETGSGKSTQLTQYLCEAGYAENGIVAATQPRRVAAMSLAKRVSEEVGCQLGQDVGYKIRFEDVSSPSTKLLFLTDGMLLNDLLSDPLLLKYSVILIDEAHERSVNTDVVLGLLKKTLVRRPDLKVLVTSATMDSGKFSEFFGGCPIFIIPGRTFDIDVVYTKEPETDYLEAALDTVMWIHLEEPQGDILVFLTGAQEIEEAVEVLSQRSKALGPNVPPLLPMGVYAQQASEVQSQIFDPAPPGTRKCVLATNIAETSLTIDGIVYVVDPGFVKQSVWNPQLGMDSLIVTPISRAQANQRKGRAGRTGPGKCFRLYTEEAYRSEMIESTIPEIQRQNLGSTILTLKAMGVNDLLHFEMLDKPPVQTIITALESLFALGALDEEGMLTRQGLRMSEFPMEPELAKVLIAAVEMGCAEEMMSIVAMLSVQNVFHRPKDKQQQADQKKAKFHDPHGDILTLLNVYRSYRENGMSSSWCHENFIIMRQMRRCEEVRKQLVEIMKRQRHKITSCGPHTDSVRRAFCSGFFAHAARKDPQEGYKTLVEGTPVSMHPSSSLFGKGNAEFVVYFSLVLTTKEYMHVTTAIEPRWLVEAAPRFFKEAPTDRLSKRKKAERIQPLHNKFAGEDDWRLSAQKRQGRGGGGGTWG